MNTKWKSVARRAGSVGAVLTVGVAGLVATPTTASANPDTTPQVYWSSGSYNAIGRIGLDGSNQTNTLASTAGEADDLLVTAAHIYWTNSNTGTIGRMNRDGSEVNQSFITGLLYPSSLTTMGGRLFWAETGRGRIGRSWLDGSGASYTFLTGLTGVSKLASSSTRLYWSSASQGKIGVADINGSWYNPNSIVGLNGPRDLAVTSNYLFWSSRNTQSIGRASIDPSHVGGTDIRYSLVTGTREISGLSVYGNYLYWGNYFTNTVGRARVDGTEVNQFFLSNVIQPWDIAFYFPPAPPPPATPPAGMRVAQRPTTNCVTPPRALPRRGSARLVKLPCYTNGRRGVNVRVTSSVRRPAARPVLRMVATGPVARRGIYVRTKRGNMRVTITWSAPATTTHFAYRVTRTYRI